MIVDKCLSVHLYLEYDILQLFKDFSNRLTNISLDQGYL